MKKYYTTYLYILPITIFTFSTILFFFHKISFSFRSILAIFITILLYAYLKKRVVLILLDTDKGHISIKTTQNLMLKHSTITYKITDVKCFFHESKGARNRTIRNFIIEARSNNLHKIEIPIDG